jgi:hypothetical protein
LFSRPLPREEITALVVDGARVAEEATILAL